MYEIENTHELSGTTNLLIEKPTGLGSGIAHPIYKMIEHQLGFALSATTGTGINGKYSHPVLR